MGASVYGVGASVYGSLVILVSAQVLLGLTLGLWTSDLGLTISYRNDFAYSAKLGQESHNHQLGDM